jgi:hypothetical protein
MDQYRILSLDGGGSWALIQVKTLINLFSKTGNGTDVTGHQVLKNFDLAVANSGGSITLGGLLTDMKLSDLLGFFLDEASRKSIFVDAGFFSDPFSYLLHPIGIGPKYDTPSKLKGLKGVLKQTGELMVSAVASTIGTNYAGAIPDVVFCAFDYDANREVFFRSNVASLAASGSAPLQTTVALAIHASTNAPLNYFDAPAQGPNGTRYWDGAVGGYNNPVLAGVIEALANGNDRAEVIALSLGTANVALPPQTHAPNEDPVLVAPRADSTIVNDLRKMATSILDDPPDAASFHAHIMLGGPLPAHGSAAPVTTGPVVRMNPLVQPMPGNSTAQWVLPSGLSDDEFGKLVQLDMDAIEQDQVLLISKLCDLWLANKVRNQGIRVVRETLLPDIGHATFADAKKAWIALCAPAAAPAPHGPAIS